MDKNDIRTKCRKVYLVTTDSRLFGNEPVDKLGEPRFIPAFRTKEIADQNVSDRQAAQTKIYNLDRFGRPKKPLETHKTVAVYLVPASKIDE